MLTSGACIDGAAIATVVTVAEILKNNGLAVEKSKFFPVMHIATHYLYIHTISMMNLDKKQCLQYIQVIQSSRFQ